MRERDRARRQASVRVDGASGAAGEAPAAELMGPGAPHTERRVRVSGRTASLSRRGASERACHAGTRPTGCRRGWASTRIRRSCKRLEHRTRNADSDETVSARAGRVRHVESLWTTETVTVDLNGPDRRRFVQSGRTSSFRFRSHGPPQPAVTFQCGAAANSQSRDGAFFFTSVS